MEKLIIINGDPQVVDSCETFLKKQFDNYAKVRRGCWLVKSTEDIEKITNIFSQEAKTSKILVFDVSNSAWASYNLDLNIIGWLKQ